MRIRISLTLVAAAALVTGCEWITGTDPCAGPFVNAVDPRSAERLVLGEAGSDSVVLVDLYLAGDTVNPTPTPEEVEGVRAHGGRVRWVYRIRAVRAEISEGGLYDLYRDPEFPLVVAIIPADPDLHTVSVFVEHDPAVSVGRFFESLGGIVRADFSVVPFISGWIDDTSLPCLWDYEYVDFIEHSRDRISTQ